MARYPGAVWRGPVPNYTPGGMRSHRGLVLHIQQGSEAGTDSWFHNPSSQVSAHFGNPKSGPLDQWVDTDDRAWAEVAGNPDWISVENEGNSGNSLTPSQLENVSRLLAWLHTTYAVPLQVSDSSVPGLTGHGLGGSAWGGHYDCPGAPILAQRPAIIARAAAILGTAPSSSPSTPSGGSPVGTIPPSIAQKWPELAGDFPPNAGFTDESALIWGDAGARAAALYARQALDAVRALTARIGSPVSVDVAALAAALAPHLESGASADEVATAVVAHLAAAIQNG
jgi:hypothetical protein